MIDIVDEALEHASARERLLDASFGPDRRLKTSERLRTGRLPVFAFAALDETGMLVGTVRLWSVADPNGRQTLLLGPLAVAQGCRGQKVGDRLMRHALNQAVIHGHGSVILVGDAPYYARFGFEPDKLGKVELPGPVDYGRFLGIELSPGHLAPLKGELSANGCLDSVHVSHPTGGTMPVFRRAQ